MSLGRLAGRRQMVDLKKRVFLTNLKDSLLG
jgi:hypothetical protein